MFRKDFRQPIYYLPNLAYVSEGNGFSNNVLQFIQDFAFPCYYEDCEDLPHLSRDNTIREAVVTSSQAKGKMRDTTSGANDALADLPKLLQEGGTDSRLQCGLRTSLSARVVEDRNSYVSGATWRQTSSFRVIKFKGEEELIGTRVRYESVSEAREERTSLPITLSTVKGRARNQRPQAR